MKHLIYTKKNGEEIEFDDFCDNTEEFNSYWTCMCPTCLEKHREDLDVKSDNAGVGTCSVLGCNNNADYYIDFKKDEVKITDSKRYAVLIHPTDPTQAVSVDINESADSLADIDRRHKDALSDDPYFLYEIRLFPINNNIPACLIVDKGHYFKGFKHNGVASLIANTAIFGNALYLKYMHGKYHYFEKDEAEEIANFFNQMKKFCVVERK